jgi:hypothetical protein
MVKDFFGLAGSDGNLGSGAGSNTARRAGDAERDAFMRDQMDMSERAFDDFPDLRKGSADVTPFTEYALTGALLQDRDGRSLLERVESRVQLEMDRIMAAYDIKPKPAKTASAATPANCWDA